MTVNEALTAIGLGSRYAAHHLAALQVASIVCGMHTFVLVFLVLTPVPVCLKESYPCDPVSISLKRYCAEPSYVRKQYQLVSGSLILEWDIACNQRWLVQFVGVAFFFGSLIGSFSAGPLSDRFGRRKAFIAGLIAVTVCSSSGVFAKSFPVFVLCRVLHGAAVGGLFMVTFVYGSELYAGVLATIAGGVLQVGFALGYIVIVLVAFLWPSWEDLCMVPAGFAAAILPWACLCAQESPQWLAAGGQLQRAHSVLCAIQPDSMTWTPSSSSAVGDAGVSTSFRFRDVEIVATHDHDAADGTTSMTGGTSATASPNPTPGGSGSSGGVASGGGTRVAVDSFGSSPTGEVVAMAKDKNPQHQQQPQGIYGLLRARRLRIVVAKACAAWMLLTLGYYGLATSAEFLQGSIYVNCVWLALMDLPALFFVGLASAYFGNRDGTKWLMVGTSLGCLGFMLPIAALSKGSVFFGQLCVTAAVSLVYIYTAEVVPTQVRSLCMGVVSAFGSIGAMGSMLLRDVGNDYPNGPMLIWATACAGAALAMHSLPTTTTAVSSPQTIAEFEERHGGSPHDS